MTTISVNQVNANSIGFPDIDVSDVSELNGLAQLLIIQLQLAGGTHFDYHMPTPDERKITRDIQQLITMINRRLMTAHPSELYKLTALYDILYRIGFQRIPSKTKHRVYRKQYLDAWMHGDTSITTTDIADMMQDSMRSDPGSLSQKQMLWYFSLTDEWSKTLRYANSFSNLPKDEHYSRLSILLRENLWASLTHDEANVKRRWVTANITNDCSQMSTKTLVCYHRFIKTAWPTYLNDDERWKTEHTVVDELLQRTDLNRFEREALRLRRIHNMN